MGFAESVGDSFGQMIGSGIGQKVTDKVFGVPKPPSPPSGYELGTQAKDYFDRAFPGTTVFERLGVNSPTGSVESARQSAGISAASSQLTSRREMMNQNFMQRFQLGLEKYKVDTDAKLRSRELDLREKELPASIQSKQFGSPTSALKSYGDMLGEGANAVFGLPQTIMGIMKRKREIESNEKRKRDYKDTRTYLRRDRRINVKVNGQ